MKKRLLSLLLSSTFLAGCASWRNYMPLPWPKKKKNLSALFPTRAANLEKLKRECTQVDQPAAEVPEGAKTLWLNMRDMKEGGTISGTTVANFAAEYGIYYCYEKLKDEDGYWISRQSGVATITDHMLASAAYLSAIQWHETVHGMQDVNGLLTTDPGWDIASFQARSLSIEAAAKAGSILYAIEEKVAGRSSLWNTLSSRDSMFIANVMNNIYNEEIRKGVPHKEALLTAGQTGTELCFFQSGWLDFYNERVLFNYINELNRGWIQPPSGKTFTVEQSQLAGKLSDDFNFTANMKELAVYQNRFGGNNCMLHAFAAAELARYEKTLGPDHADTVSVRAALTANNNPFLGIDLKPLAGKENPLKLMMKQMGKKSCSMR